ncbi:aryl-sulfate sulfotransferase [Oceanobacillus rekensis]|uniref:aryl-sulfate sulfotransferase n=1 Tax=Oceanobacillus rekensis TaxID=937927 RepID=UPI000B434E8A|nr:aryl-sulfate sulfotransferase [Oceanobacillus rekensis]
MVFRKIILAIVAVVFIFTGTSQGLAVEAQGNPVKSGNQQVLDNVPDSDLLEIQSKLEQGILDEYKKGDYSLSDPFVMEDPYGWSPLTALVMFETDEKSQVTVEVEGKDEYTSVSHTFHESTKKHQVPVYGLYAGTDNRVIITAMDKDGNEKSKVLTITTEPLPEYVQDIEVKTADPEKMKDGLTFTSNMFAFDSNGDVRWYINSEDYQKDPLEEQSSMTRLDNGNFLVQTDQLQAPVYYKTGLFEMDLMGKVYNIYTVNGQHHDAIELPNGNILALAEREHSETVEDYAIEIHRNSGKIVNEYNLGEIVQMEDSIANGHHIEEAIEGFSDVIPDASEEEIRQLAIAFNEKDYLHVNSVFYNEEDDSIIFSSRHQDAVVKFDKKTGEVIWILSDPNRGEWPEELRDKLLTPVGEDFQWQYAQHAASQLENGNILLYDNGNGRTEDVNDNYSRAVEYKIDEENMTVEQVWSYGQERGSKDYTSFIGDTDYLGDNSYLITFGGHITNNDGEVIGNIFSQTLPGNYVEGTIVEVVNDEVVFEADLGYTYRSERNVLYVEEEEYDIGKQNAKRLGELHKTAQADIDVSPEEAAELNASAVQWDEIQDEGNLLALKGTVETRTDTNDVYVVLDPVKNGDALIYHAGTNGNIHMSVPGTIDRPYLISKTGIRNGTYSINILVRDANGKDYYTETGYHWTVK